MAAPHPRPDADGSALPDLTVHLASLAVPPVVVQRDVGWHARLELPLLGEACASSRRVTQVLLRAWQVPQSEASHDALLVVSELVGNAVRHGGERVALELELQDGVLVVGVRDDADGVPRPRRADEVAEGGRGLAIVAAVSEQWGCEELGGGTKRVWARLRVA